MRKLKCLTFAISILMGISCLTGCACQHKQWNEADCTTPKTCAECGITEGEPLGHKWKESTCQAPKTCEVCQETEGTVADHSTHTGKCEYCSEYILDEAFIPDVVDYTNTMMFNNMSVNFNHTVLDTESSGTTGFDAHVSIPDSMRIDDTVNNGFDYVLHYYGTKDSNCLQQLFMYIELNDTSETDNLYEAVKDVMNDRYGSPYDTHTANGKEFGVTWHDSKGMLSINLTNGDDCLAVALELIDFPF